MSASDRRVIALGNLAGELKTSLEAAVRAAELELLLTREPARAFVELEREGALAMLVDMATLGAEQFCKRARGTERLRTVPVIGMSRHPNELGFARVFAWGADDLVPLGAVAPLERRLKALRGTQRPDAGGFGQAVVAEATTQRRALVGRVLAQAGYDVKFAVDRGAVELYASQAETRLVVISAALGDPRRIIEAAARAGALPTWIVTAEARSVARLASSLLGLDRVAVTSTSGSPEDVLFLANELVFGKGARRREWRALYATPVAFRSLGSDSDEYGFSYDASPGGLYVRSLLPCESDEVEVELRLPNRDERVRLFGKVARRFAFGSGAIASAPPGFSVKLEGPPDDLEHWADACQKLIEASSDALTNPPPGGRGEDRISSPPNTESNLAVPPATLTIESVVAPLPAAVLAEVEKGTDVGELLAAALDEQTLAQVGTKPVTMDVHSGDVREERPSEFALHVPSELLGESDVVTKGPAPEDSTPALGEGPVKLPLPAPASSPSAALAKPAEPAAPAEPPLVDPRFDWDSDAKTAVRQSRPDTEAPVQKSSADAAAAVRQSQPDTEIAALRRSQPDVEEEAPATRKMVSPEPITRPEMPAAKATAKEPSPVPPAAAVAVGVPLAPSLRAHGRSTMIGVAPPALGSAPAAPGAAPGLGKTQVLPPPRTKLPSSPGLPEPRTKLPSSPGISEPRAAPPPAPAEPASVTAEPERLAFDDAPPTPTSPQLPEFDSAPIDRDDWALGLEEALSPREEAPAPREAPAPKPLPERELPSGTAATILAGPGYAPNVSVANAAPYRAQPAASPPPASRGKSIVIGLFAALALGGGLALVLPKSNSGTTTAEAPAPSAPPANTGEAVATGTSPTAAPQQEVAPAPASAAGTNPAPATSASPPASVASAAPPEPPATAAPAASSPATSAPEPAAAPAPAQIDFDVRKLPPDRAALYVRSSADTHVFVHGTDYGSTNQVLITTCGIRFVRLGRTLGDFVEPGRSYVIKCGRINQFAIEPAR